MKYINILLFALWAFITIAHTFIVYNFFQFPFSIAIIDSLISNSLFLVVGYGLWFLSKIFDWSKQKFSFLLLNYAAATLALIFLWSSLSVLILKNFFSEHHAYNNFLFNSIIYRSVIGLLLCFVLIWMFHLIKLIAIKNWQISHHQQLYEQLRTSQMNALKAQINPHFLFNSLNSIQMLIESEPDKAIKMIQCLSELMRYSFSKQEQFVLFEEEIEQMIKYTEIEKIRFGNRLNINTSLSEGTHNAKFPTMMLQPLIENAVKYSIYTTTDEVYISLHAELVDNTLTIKLINNFNPHIPVSKGNGMGLRHVQERLFSIFFRNDLFRTEVHSDLFIVTLKIPQL